MDKNEAFLWVIWADIQLSLCKNEEAIDSLRQAKDIALRFDEVPNYSAAYTPGHQTFRLAKKGYFYSLFTISQ